MSEKILVIEDDSAVITMLNGALTSIGYQVDSATNGVDGLERLRSKQYALVLLDVMMPRMDGMETLRQLRQFTTVPVIMLTGRDADTDQIKGLEDGADDYILKPASIAVIRARVRAALRRSKKPARPEPPILSFDQGALVIDQVKAEVMLHGVSVELTPTEYRLLMYLVSNAGHPVDHREVLASVWGHGYETPEVLKLFISRLRTKIEPDPGNARYVLTHRGRGYYFGAEPDAPSSV